MTQRDKARLKRIETSHGVTEASGIQSMRSLGGDYKDMADLLSIIYHLRHELNVTHRRVRELENLFPVPQ